MGFPNAMISPSHAWNGEKVHCVQDLKIHFPTNSPIFLQSRLQLLISLNRQKKITRKTSLHCLGKHTKQMLGKIFHNIRKTKILPNSQLKASKSVDTKHTFLPEVQGKDHNERCSTKQEVLKPKRAQLQH